LDGPDLQVVLELVNITKKFSGFTIGPLNLKIADDDILVMLGPTGNGKTTILNLIVGLLKPDGGHIVLDGVDITQQPVESRNIGYSFQRPSLFPYLNVYQNITFGLKKKDKENKDRQIKKLVENLGISHLINRRIQGLSGGEMQKISLARTLLVEPKIMLMDEPLANLDDPTKIKLRVEIRELIKNQGISCIYVTHFEDDVYALADSVAILKNGQVEKMDKLDRLLSYPHNLTSPFLMEILKGGYNYIEGNVVESKNGITIINSGAHMLEIQGDHTINYKVGILVRPEDIILSTERVKTSARNIIKTRIVKITNNGAALGIVDIHLVSNNIYLVSRITNESKIYLEIKEGGLIYAMFKTTSPKVIREGKYTYKENGI
jgi:molybdopterin-binding protein